MERVDLERWIGEYERAWRTAGTEPLSRLFADDVAYLASPWAEPVRGLASLAMFWEAERTSPDEQFTMTADVVAVDGDVGVARVEVSYGTGQRWRDLWVVRLDAGGRCVAFEEWPFAPNQQRT
jgi:hypothetical protein